MKSNQPISNPLALVAAFDDFQIAKEVVESLLSAGFVTTNVELINQQAQTKPPGFETPKVQETTASAAQSGVFKGAGIGLGLGAGFGVAALVLTASPGLAVGAMIYAGLAGALYGGVGGIDKADLDDSINLPTLEEYRKLVDEGGCIVVVYGTHKDLLRAEAIVKKHSTAENHIHRLHGHLFHEHPAPHLSQPIESAEKGLTDKMVFDARS